MKGINVMLLCVLWGMMMLCSSCVFAQTILLGTYTNNSALDQHVLSAMQSWQGRKLDLFATFNDFCNSTAALDRLNQQLLNVFANDQSILITWSPTFCDSTPDDVDSYIASGNSDKYITAAADIMNSQLNQYVSSNIYIRFARNPNTDTYPWSASYPQTKKHSRRLHKNVESW